jgi:signal transduction histidine kinase/HAMP domain-containing protein
MGIRAKLLGGFLLVALFTGAMGLYSAIAGQQLKAGSESIYSDAYGETYLLATWLNEVRHSEGELASYLLADDQVNRAEIRADMDDFDAKLVIISAQISALDMNAEDDADPRPLFASWGAFVNWRDSSILGAIDAGEWAAARETYRLNGEAYSEVIDAEANSYLAAKKQAASELHDALVEAGLATSRLTLTIAAGATISALLIGLFLSRTIAATAGEVAAAAKGLAQGDLDQRIEVRSRDELGVMAEAVREAIAYQQEMARVAISIAAGDLSQDVEPKGSRDVLGLAFRRMVTNLRALLAELHEHTALIASITDSMSDGLVVIGSDRIVTYANAPATAFFDSTPSEVIGAELQRVYGGLSYKVAEPESVARMFVEAAGRLADRPRYEMVLVGPPRRTIAVQLFPISDTGSKGMLLHDITPERQLLEAKDELVSMVSHELASPATNLVAYAELLATGEYPPRERNEMLATLVQEGQRLTSIIQDFLDIRRLEHGGFQLTPRPVDVLGLLEHAARVARADADHPFTVDIPVSLPLVQIDPNRVQQVIANLLSNARKYTPSGGRISLTARQIVGSVEISVADEGLGIPLEAQARLFDKFFRVDTEDRRLIKGTGLGLAIVKEIVEALGGRIGVESAGPGSGSRFWFTLPLATQPAAVASPGSATGLRVLVVDDDAAIRNAVRRVLRVDGHLLKLVDSGEEALAQLTAQPFDVVLTDLGLGTGMDGWELIGNIRNDWPAVRIVLASGRVEIEGTDARARGVTTVLAKPYQPDDLRRAIGAEPIQLAA